jgi:cycloeucalenol cycloisomerase
MDEGPQARKWTVSQAFFDSLAAGMLVTIILDLWRVCVGGIVPSSVQGLAWAP